MKQTHFVRTAALLFGFAFLYAPIALLVLYSFNASRLVTVWGGFSTRWYASLLENEQLIASAWISLRVALVAEGIPHEYEESPGGHEWPYWRARVADSLRFFAAAL